MASLKVLIAVELEERHLKSLAAAHPNVEFMYGTEAIFGYDARYNRPPGAATAAHLDPDAALGQMEVMLSLRFPRSVVERALNLKWIQVLSAGVNWLSGHPILKTDVVVTSANGVAAIPIAEWVVCAMLMLVKRIPFATQNHRERRWLKYTGGELNTKTIGIVGLGHIGTEVARKAKAMGMRVLAIRRSADSGPLPDYVDQMYPRERLLDLLSASDFVALCVPLTAETEKVIGEAELRAMRPSAFLINISRGGVIDEPVLIRALKEGWIAGAGLDVFAQEPLPPESELWDLPNLIMTPHTSSTSEYQTDRIVELFSENIRRYIAGEKMINVMDKSKGY